MSTITPNENRIQAHSVEFEMFNSKTHVNTNSATELNQIAQREYRQQLSDSLDVNMNADGEDTEMPIIRSPQRNLNNAAQVLLIMATLSKNISETNIEKLNSRLAILNAQSQARSKTANEYSGELDKLEAKWDAVNEEYKGLELASTEAEEALNTAKNQYDTAKKQLENLLQKYDENSPEVIQAKTTLTDAQKAVDTAQKKRDSAVVRQEAKLGELSNLTTTINAKLDAIEAKYADGITEYASTRTLSQQQQDTLTRTGAMVLILAEFITQMSENATEKLKNDMDTFRIQADARQKEMTRKSDEYKEQVRKAEEAQKMAGCIGKILGGLAIAFGAITSVFGGGGLAVMAVGMALMAADTVMEKLTGQSLTGMLLNPIMEKVLMPLLQIIGDIVGKLLENSLLGVLLNALDKATGMDITSMVKGLATAAVTIALVMALAYVAKSAGKMLMEKMSGTIASAVMQSVKKAIIDAVRKIVPQSLKTAGRQGKELLSQISNSLDKIATHPRMMKAMTWSNRAQWATETANSGVQLYASLKMSEFQIKMAKAMNDFNTAQVDLDILKDGLQKAMNQYSQISEIGSDMSSMLSDALENRQKAAHTIASNISY